MSPPAENSVGVGDSLWPTASISSNVFGAAIIFFFILLLFFLVLYLFHRLHRRHSRPIFISPGTVTFRHRGLDAVILCALPVTVFKVDPEEEIKCAVCLCKLSDGEEVRVLPECNHGFHLECIDMWFHSHSTCPLCRNPIGLPVSEGNPDSEPVTAESTMVMQGFLSSPSTPIPTSVTLVDLMATKTTPTLAGITKPGKRSMGTSSAESPGN